MALKKEVSDYSVCMTPEISSDIYSYCDIVYPEEKKSKICKYDYCNMCCIDLQKIISKGVSYKENIDCFKKCGKRNVLI